MTDATSKGVSVEDDDFVREHPSVKYETTSIVHL